MILCCDSVQLCEPGDTIYILEVSPWSPGVLKSFGLKAVRYGKFFKKLIFWELQLDQKNPSHFL